MFTRVVFAGASVALRGDAVECPCCGGRFRRFLTYPSLICPRCGAAERHRTLCLWLDAHPELLPAGSRVLHVAPDPSLMPRLDRPETEYVSIDLDYPLATMRMNVTRMTFADASFDLAVCSHVLESVPDAPAGARELLRVLRPGGLLIVMWPRHLPQEDPVRLLEGASFDLRVENHAEAVGEAARSRYGLLTDELLYLATRPG